MEIVVKRALVLSAVLAAFGVAAQLQPALATKALSEKQIQAMLPTSIGRFSMEPSREDPAVSYKATEFEYQALNAFGIVGRVFNDGDKRFDTTVVAGNDRDSFHDPNFCLAGSYFNIFGAHEVSLDTAKRGKIPMTVMVVENKDGKRFVAFSYLGPHGFHPTQNTLYSDWFWTELKLGKPELGAFYRFSTTDEQTSEDKLLKFASAYFDAAFETSKGKL